MELISKFIVPYTEPNYEDGELFNKEFMYGLSDRAGLDFLQSGRYSGGLDIKLSFDKRDMLGGLNTDYYSQMCQLCYLPQYAQGGENEIKTLAFSPPINHLSRALIYDFFHKDAFGNIEIKNFPVGSVVEANGKCCGYFYNKSDEGIAVGSICDKGLAQKGQDKNVTNFTDFSHTGELCFSLVFLGKDLEVLDQRIYQKPKYNYNKLSSFNDRLYLINYDISSKNVDFILLGTSSANVLSSVKLRRGTLRFYRTYMIDLVYDSTMFVVFNKAKSIAQKVECSTIRALNFNPALKTVCVFDGNLYTIYSAISLKPIYKSATVDKKIAFHALSWRGNFRYDYVIENRFSPQLDSWLDVFGGRGHYPQSYFNFEFDNTIGRISSLKDTPLGYSGDLYLNNTDDADVGLKSYLASRNIKKPHDEITIANPTYARCYKKFKQLFWYSLDYDNDFGKIVVFDYK